MNSSSKFHMWGVSSIIKAQTTPPAYMDILFPLEDNGDERYVGFLCSRSFGFDELIFHIFVLFFGVKINKKEEW